MQFIVRARKRHINFEHINFFLVDVSRKTREGCGCFRGLCRSSAGKFRENSGKIAGKIFPNREMLQILGFQAPGKANLPETLGPHCRDLVPTFRAGCFLKSTVPAFSSFSEFQPRKKIFSPPPPKKFPNSPRTPSRPLGPSPFWKPPPPPGTFNKKTGPPPPGASDPPSPLPEQKKKKKSETSTKF